MNNNIAPSTQERVWAVMSHLSALTFGMGILLPVIGWSEQRRKSRYTSFQCLQALGYQSLGFTIWVLTLAVLVILFSCILVVATGIYAQDSATSAMISSGFGIVVVIVVLGFLGLYFILPVIAAISCIMGRDFRYPILGDRLANYLGYDDAPGNDEQWLIEEHEDRWVTAMGHFAVIIMLWGALAPLTAWILQGKRSLFLKFQSLQAVVFHGVVVVLYFGSSFVYFAGFVAFVVLAGLGKAFSGTEAVSIVGLVFFLITMIVAALVTLVIPLFHITGQWAGYRTLKGDDYRYPVIGKWLEKRVMNSVPLAKNDLPEAQGG